MKVYLDDTRNLPDGFDVLVRNVTACKELIMSCKIEVLSLDHDLGINADGVMETGYDVAKFIENGAWNNRIHEIPLLICHSQNPVGKQNILMAFQSAKKGWECFRTDEISKHYP